jgi:hypothetical protein
LLRSECSACRLLPSAVRVTTSIATAADGPVRRTVDPLALPQALQHCFELIAVDTVGVHQRLNDGRGQELFERWLGDAAEDRVRAPERWQEIAARFVEAKSKTMTPLFARYVPQQKGSEEFYKRASEARNMLMHGDEVKSIEEALNLEFSELVDHMGELAWVSLMNQFIPALVGKQPMFIQTNQYVHMTMTGNAIMQIGFVPNFDNPDPAHFPKVQISMTTTKRTREPHSQSLPPGPVPDSG